MTRVLIVAGSWRQREYPSSDARVYHATVKSNALETYPATWKYVEKHNAEWKIEEKKCISPNNIMHFYRHLYIWKHKPVYLKRYQAEQGGTRTGSLQVGTSECSGKPLHWQWAQLSDLMDRMQRGGDQPTQSIQCSASTQGLRDHWIELPFFFFF